MSRFFRVSVFFYCRCVHHLCTVTSFNRCMFLLLTGFVEPTCWLVRSSFPASGFCFLVAWKFTINPGTWVSSFSEKNPNYFGGTVSPISLLERIINEFCKNPLRLWLLFLQLSMEAFAVFYYDDGRSSIATACLHSYRNHIAPVLSIRKTVLICIITVT